MNLKKFYRYAVVSEFKTVRVIDIKIDIELIIESVNLDNWDVSSGLKAAIFHSALSFIQSCNLKTTDWVQCCL